MQRYSGLFGKTNKTAKEFDSQNATLLQKGGFIDQVMAGVYTFLPLGLRVLAKIENIIREEMDKIASELLMPSLTPKANWQESGRLETVDVLMKTVAANEISKKKSSAEYILAPTHEDIVTPLAKTYCQSYKHLPFAVYQIQSKFRNEARAKSGLLRGREFRMKDLYSFHSSDEDLHAYYEVVKQSYWNIFNKLGLGADTVVALASGGDFTPNFSHEFQTRSEAGEDHIFRVKSKDLSFNREVAPSRISEQYIKEKEEPLKEVKGQGIIGVEELSRFLNIPVWRTTKTLFYETEKGELIAAALRGDYEVNEDKLRKIINCKTLTLAGEEHIKQETGAAVGYAGIINLPESIRLFCDDSMEGRSNFECGANKTDYHAHNVNFGRDVKEPEKFYDFKLAKAGDLYPETGEAYEVFRACEVGNIFPLDTKFSEAFDYTYTDSTGKKHLIWMGCYGIGSSRIVGVIAEKYNDDKGLIWPEAVAPYDIHLITIKGYEKEAEQLALKLEEVGRQVLYDDREGLSAGEKFADADLIGLPVRVLLSDKSMKAGGAEVKRRAKEDAEIIPLDKLVSRLK